MSRFRILAAVTVCALAVVSGVDVMARSAAPIAGAQDRAPCAPDLITPPAPKPAGLRAPTNLRIVGGGEESWEEVRESGPFVGETEIEPWLLSAHPYFDLLSNRPECQVAYALRTQAELDAIVTNGLQSLKKLPITYDPTMDAALFKMYAPSSADTHQKIVPVRVSGSSVLLTWDFRFDQYFKWEGAGYMSMHKTWRLDVSDRPWLALKTDYQRAANQGKGIAEFIFTLPNSHTAGPGTSRGGNEIAEPRLADFYIEPHTWTRAWWLLEQVNEPVCYVSLWIADPDRGAVRLYNRLAINVPEGGLTTGSFRFEYDTSMDTALNPVAAHSWNRNFVVLPGLKVADVEGLLHRPTR